MPTKNLANKKGFTLMEVMVALSLFVFAILIIGSLFIISQKSFNKGATRNELAQNCRVALDRFSREIRQAVEVVTALPLNQNDPLNPPPSEIIFQDGHQNDIIKYIKYYLSDSALHRAEIVYYFPTFPEVFVSYDSLDALNNPPLESVLDDKQIGEYFSEIKYWGGKNYVNIYYALNKGSDIFTINTFVSIRN